jgi:hypothetical protein
MNDLQLLLDNTTIFNTSQSSTPEIASDNYYLTENDWNSLSSATQKNSYIWDRDVYNDTKSNDWFYIFRSVLYANDVLEKIEKYETESATPEFKNIKGSAFFFRANSLFQAIQIWAMQYEAASATTTKGIPIRTSSDFNTVSKRETLTDSYSFIISDLLSAVSLLPDEPVYQTRPSKPAAFALLARIYLQQQKYLEAGNMADSCLAYKSELLDYNNISSSLANPFPRFGVEVIFHSSILNIQILTAPRCKIDTTLYYMYQAEDLRKGRFFRSNNDGSFSFKGSYDGSAILFNGIATDELYLIKAECEVRQGRILSGLNWLDSLLIKRFTAGHYIPVVTDNKEVALEAILNERRKELLMRQLRWNDLKRLNLDQSTSVILSRKIGSMSYELLPRSNKYAFPIPDFIVQNSGVDQNL